MTVLNISSDRIDGLRLLADILQRAPGVPGPRALTSCCVLATTDAEGTVAIDEISIRLDRSGVAYRIEDTDHSRKLIITLAKNFEYEVFYVYRNAMNNYHAQDSYYDNIVIDTETH